MSTKELREKAHRTVDAIPEHQLERFAAMIEKISTSFNEPEFDTLVNRIIEDDREVIRRLAQGPSDQRQAEHQWRISRRG